MKFILFGFTVITQLSETFLVHMSYKGLPWVDFFS